MGLVKAASACGSMLDMLADAEEDRLGNLWQFQGAELTDAFINRLFAAGKITVLFSSRDVGAQVNMSGGNMTHMFDVQPQDSSKLTSSIPSWGEFGMLDNHKMTRYLESIRSIQVFNK